MRKGIILFSLFVIFSAPVMAATGYVPKQFANTNTGEGLYPYALNNRRQQTQTKNNVSPIGGGTAPMQQMGKRGVTKRPVRARAATTQTNTASQPRRVIQRSNVMRSATTNGSTPRTTKRTIDSRGVVARGAVTPTTMRSSNVKRITTSSTGTSAVSPQKCFANYKECMESYCKREDTAYNRCYCSAKLAQIDSKYQNKIDSLIQEIIKLQYQTDEMDSDVKQYWDETVGIYTNTNPWVNIDNALNINWADTESRVRGQNAFNTGHQYCVNYLRSCASMASNLRDAYKSEIARDCTAYEDTLKRLQTVAESVVEHYSK